MTTNFHNMASRLHKFWNNSDHGCRTWGKSVLSFPQIYIRIIWIPYPSYHIENALYFDVFRWMMWGRCCRSPSWCVSSIRLERSADQNTVTESLSPVWPLCPLPKQLCTAGRNYAREQLCKGGSCDIWATTFDMESGQAKSWKKGVIGLFLKGGGSTRGSEWKNKVGPK